jgi:hypothetical protein
VASGELVTFSNFDINTVAINAFKTLDFVSPFGSSEQNFIPSHILRVSLK